MQNGTGVRAPVVTPSENNFKHRFSGQIVTLAQAWRQIYADD